MKKAYWVVTYRSVSDQTKLDNYAKLAAPAIVEAGGNILVRGLPSAVLEEGQVERTVVTEFANLDAAMNAYKSDQYKKTPSPTLRTDFVYRQFITRCFSFFFFLFMRIRG